MSWLQQLYKTYEHASILDNLPEDQQLAPIGHTSQNAHLHIVIDGEGNFLRAEVLKKTQIILPATEDSQSRGNGINPHPLADKLQYVAQDYSNYGGIKKSFFESYHTQLKQWAESKDSHPSVCAVLKYIEKGTVIADLVQAKLIYLDENQKYIEKWENSEMDPPEIFSVLPKTKGQIDISSALVAWSVEIFNVLNTKTWQDKSLHQSWINFQFSQAGQEGFCFVEGIRKNITLKHPSKIRHSGDKAKLISANDTAGLTYLGRFWDSQQAVMIGADVSQKAHTALSWLINTRHQAQKNGDQVTIAWALSGHDIPNPLSDGLNEVDEIDWDSLEKIEPILQPHKNDAEQDESYDHSQDLGQNAAKVLCHKLRGYSAKLSDTDQLTVLSLDSATPGRMAITYYQQFMPKEYFDALEQWQTDFAWFIRHSKVLPSEGNKKEKIQTTFPFIAPIPYAIAQAAYGKALTDEFKKQLIQRLLPNILEPNRSFPLDIVQRCIALVFNRQGFEPWEWERNLGVTCGLYRGYYARHSDKNQRRSFSVPLDENNHSRDYLYGRLLAVAEELESLALYSAGEKRATSAERYFQQFANRPFTTWLTISTGLRPYQDRLRNSRAGFLKNREDELTNITAKFDIADFKDDSKLSGEFLLGYHNQKMSYKKSKSVNEETTESTTI